MTKIKTLVTFLQMCEQKHEYPAPFPDHILLKRVKNISISQYRQIYKQIGEKYYWVSRKVISDSELKVIIHHPKVEIYILCDTRLPTDEQIIGFFEISAQNAPRSAEISFIGLVDNAIGKGLGLLLTQYAIQYAWAQNVGRILIQTCTLDHKRALPLYQKLGFSAYNRQNSEIEWV